MNPVEIDDALKEFLESGVSIIVATRDAQLRPEAVRATGLQVADRTHVRLVIPAATGARTFENLEANGEVAFVASDPATYRTVQLKGRSAGVAPLDDAGRADSRRWLDAFTEATLRFGLRPTQIRNLWLEDARQVRVEITAAFHQTPGPGAGRPLAASDSEAPDHG